MIHINKKNVNRRFKADIYGNLPIISAKYSGINSNGEILFFLTGWPILKMIGYSYADYVDSREYLIALDPDGIRLYSEEISPILQFIKFTDIKKLYVRHGILNPFILTIKTYDKRRFKIIATDYDHFKPIPSDKIWNLDIKNSQITILNIFYESLKSMEQSINHRKHR